MYVLPNNWKSLSFSKIRYIKEKVNKTFQIPNVFNLAETFATTIILYFGDVWKVSARLETLKFWKIWSEKVNKNLMSPIFREQL